MMEEPSLWDQMLNSEKKYLNPFKFADNIMLLVGSLDELQ